MVHDAAGNLTNDGSHPFTYDSGNRLLTAGGVTYTYDGDGKRVMKSNGTLYWIGPGWEPLLETDLAGSATAEYVFFNGERVARMDQPNNFPEVLLLRPPGLDRHRDQCHRRDLERIGLRAVWRRGRNQRHGPEPLQVHWERKRL